jgi:putative flippase GtrA
VYLNLFRYILVGGLGATIHLSILLALVEIAGSEPLPASVIGFLFSLLCSYWLNAIWTFSSPQQEHRKTSVRYIAVAVMGLCLNMFIMFLMVNVLGVWYLAGQGVAAVLVPIHNFLLNFYWTFKR